MNAVNAVLKSATGLVQAVLRVPGQLGQRAGQMVDGSGAKQLWPVLRKELAPPTMDSLPMARQHVFKLVDSAKKLKFLDVTVKDAAANTLVAVEIACWFCVGEIIGRRHFVGYNIKNTQH